MTSQMTDCDVLVVGFGLAGAISALAAADKGLNVILVHNDEGASPWAQGGIVYRGPEDPDQLIQDILESGLHRNNAAVVKAVAENSSRVVETWLQKRAQILFDRDASGNMDMALEAAHHSRRILHVKDATGAAIMAKVRETVLAHPRIKTRLGTLVDLLVSNRHDARSEKVYAATKVCGAYILSEKAGTRETQVDTLVAKAVVLATGGYSGLYQHSTGPSRSRGDGISAAQRAGARVLQLEFMQFHPTALYIPGEPRRLLTEALRGAGAQILSFDRKPFVDNLAPRDVVARAIHEEMVHSGADHVWLDLSKVAALEEKFPSMCKLIESKHFDPRHDLIPIVPAAHYSIGGVWSDEKGATSLPGLFAAGEVACTGLHGANRLASTSLLEALYFGEQAGLSASEWSQVSGGQDFVAKPWIAEDGPVDPALIAQDWQLLRQTMWNYVGLVRSEKRLKRAEKILVELRNEIESFYAKSRLTEDLIGLRHGILCANLILYSALRNRESIGVHYLKED